MNVLTTVFKDILARSVAVLLQLSDWRIYYLFVGYIRERNKMQIKYHLRNRKNQKQSKYQESLEFT